jgi:hypothetical protein
MFIYQQQNVRINHHIYIDNRSFERVEHFKYFGTNLNNLNYILNITLSKHNSLPSIIYLVIRLQCFDPLLGHLQTYIKTDCVLRFIFYQPNGIPCGLEGCIQFVQGT